LPCPQTRSPGQSAIAVQVSRQYFQKYRVVCLAHVPRQRNYSVLHFNTNFYGIDSGFPLNSSMTSCCESVFILGCPSDQIPLVANQCARARGAAWYPCGSGGGVRRKIPADFVARINGILIPVAMLSVTNEALYAQTTGPIVQVVDADPPTNESAPPPLGEGAMGGLSRSAQTLRYPTKSAAGLCRYTDSFGLIIGISTRRTQEGPQ
jgi:hypothetical protein